MWNRSVCDYVIFCIFAEVHAMIFKVKNIQEINFITLKTWVSLVGLPPDKYPPITLYNGHPELITEEDLAQWLLNVHCPVLNHLDQRTPLLGWCGTRRRSRTGSVLVGARFTQTTNGISYSSLIAMQIGSYPTLSKLPSLSVTILALFFGRHEHVPETEHVPIIKLWFAQKQISKALVYL